MDSGIYFTDNDLEKFSLSDANSKLCNIDKMRWVDLHSNSGNLYIYCNGLIIPL